MGMNEKELAAYLDRVDRLLKSSAELSDRLMARLAETQAAGPAAASLAATATSSTAAAASPAIEPWTGIPVARFQAGDVTAEEAIRGYETVNSYSANQFARVRMGLPLPPTKPKAATDARAAIAAINAWAAEEMRFNPNASDSDRRARFEAQMGGGTANFFAPPASESEPGKVVAAYRAERAADSPNRFAAAKADAVARRGGNR